MNRPLFSIAIASLLSATAGSALTWLVAFPRAISVARAGMAVDEQAQITAVAAKAADQLRAEQKAREHDAVAHAVKSLHAAVIPQRGKMTREQLIIFLWDNAAAVAAVDTFDCPVLFQEAYRQASDMVSTYAEVFSRSPIPTQGILTDVVSIDATGGVDIPILLHQAAGAKGELWELVETQKRATAALERLSRVAARYGVRL